MKRILLGAVAFAALSLGGLFTSQAEAHGPYWGGRGFVGRGYGLYNGCVPHGAYLPYAAGYTGGWQPYPPPGLLTPQPRFGLYLGF
jgi:hypothetical protein